MCSRNWGTGSRFQSTAMGLASACLVSLLPFWVAAGSGPDQPAGIRWETPQAFFPVEVIAWDPSVTPGDLQTSSGHRRPNLAVLDQHSSPHWQLGLGDQGKWARRVVAANNSTHIFEMRDGWLVPAPGTLSATFPSMPKSTLSFGYCLLQDVVAGGANKPVSARLEWRMMGGGPSVKIPLNPTQECKQFTEFSAPVPTGAQGFQIVVESESGTETRNAFVLATPAMSVRVEGTKEAQGLLEALLGSVAGPNIVLFIIDAARSDCVGPGNTQFPSVTPKLDRWYEQGVGFTAAYSVSNQTRPSITALIQGQPPTIGKFYTRALSMPAKTLRTYRTTRPPLLPLLLKLAGYTTASIGRNHFQFENTPFGLDPGFAMVWDTRAASEDTSAIVDQAMAWVKGHHDRKFLLLVNIPAPHQPYNAPLEFEKFVKKVLGKKLGLGLLRNYLAEVAFSDSETDRFLQGLKELGLLDRTVVVVTSDHGEAMAKHHVCRTDTTSPDGLRCQYGHGTTLFEEELRVPLLMLMHAFQGLKLGVRRTPATHLDLVPTLLELAGLGPHPTHVGQSMLPILAAETPSERPIYCEARLGASLRLGTYKLILKHPKETEPAKGPVSPAAAGKGAKVLPPAHPGLVLFDLQADPSETHDAGGKLPAIRDQLRERMKALREGFSKRVQEGAKLPWKPLPDWTPRPSPLSLPTSV